MKLRNKKTGCIGDFDIECYRQKGGFVKVVANDVPYYAIKKECGNLYYYDTLAEFNEDWEEYKPAEPLIKDEKIRKAVRAWAEAEDEDCYYGKDAKTIYNGSGDNIEFWSEPFENLEKDRHYTIAELCGEEE